MNEGSMQRIEIKTIPAAMVQVCPMTYEPSELIKALLELSGDVRYIETNDKE